MVEANVVASIKRCPFTSTKRLCRRRKSAPNNGFLTSARMSLALYTLFPKHNDTLRAPYVVIEEPFAA